MQSHLRTSDGRRRIDARFAERVGERVGAEEADHRVQLADAVLQRRATQAPAELGIERKGGAGRVRAAVLDVVRLVEHDTVPVDLVQRRRLLAELFVARETLVLAPEAGLEDRVWQSARLGDRRRTGGQDDVVLLELLDVGLALLPVPEVDLLSVSEATTGNRKRWCQMATLAIGPIVRVSAP